MAVSRKGRRYALLGVALVLLGANIWWFTRGKPAAAPDFELGATSVTQRVTRQEALALPRYDAARAVWSVEGRDLGDIASHARPAPDGVGGADWSGRFLEVGLGREASPEDMRRMLLALRDAGICGVAVVQDGDPVQADGAYEVPVHHLVSVRDDGGHQVACVDKAGSSTHA